MQENRPFLSNEEVHMNQLACVYVYKINEGDLSYKMDLLIKNSVGEHHVSTRYFKDDVDGNVLNFEIFSATEMVKNYIQRHGIFSR